MFFRAVNIIVMIWIVLGASGAAKAQTEVRVLAYVFPPFLNEDHKTGLTTDLIALLNSLQKDYHFVLRVSSPNRRYQMMANNAGDMLLFEMSQWGWAQSDVKLAATREIMTGGEKYITARLPGRDQSHFDSIGNKTISAYMGYHYGFANYNADVGYLRDNFNISLMTSHQRILEVVMHDKVNIGVVTLSYLRKYFNAHPELKSRFLISERFDQKYSLGALVREGGPITVHAFEKLLDQLKERKQLLGLFIANGLEDQLTY